MSYRKTSKTGSLLMALAMFGAAVLIAAVITMIGALLFGVDKEHVVETVEEAELSSWVNFKSGWEGWLNVGDTIVAQKVAITKGEYVILVENRDGALSWLETEYMNLRVKKSDEAYSYMKREKNEVSEKLIGDGYYGLEANYTLYINTSEPLTPSSWEEDCGKNCKEDVSIEEVGN